MFCACVKEKKISVDYMVAEVVCVEQVEVDPKLGQGQRVVLPQHE